MFFLITGSAGSGKSAALAELSARRDDLAFCDFDDLDVPAEVDETWWLAQIEACVAQAVQTETDGYDTVLVGWMSIEDVEAAPSSSQLEGVVACLLDCNDRVRLQRVEQRAASGTWRQHTPEQLQSFLAAAAEMRATASSDRVLLDTSALSVSEVADRLETWMTASYGLRFS